MLEEVHGYTNEMNSVIDATFDGVRKSVPADAPDNPERQMIEEWEAQGHTIPPFIAPPLPPFTLQVSLMWMRMSEAEAEAFDGAMSNATPLRLRKAFNSAQTMMSDGELFTFAEIILASSIGAARASAVLAAPEIDMAASLDMVAF